MAAATSSHLASDKVNLLELKEWLRREFLSFFEESSGKKVKIYIIDIRQIFKRLLESDLDCVNG